MNTILVRTIITLLAFAATASGAGTEPAGISATGEDASASCCDACVRAAAASTDAETHTAPELTDLESVESLREQFNEDQGVPRGIALLSPVCPGCVNSAELIQSALLETYKDANFKLYVVWLPMVPGDARDRWNPEILKDARATHFWNGSKSVGKWFAEHVTECEPLGPVAWDVVYLFGPDANWDGDKLHAEYCPTPVYRYPDELAAKTRELLGEH